MADSIRQQILSAIDTRLKAILVASGYATDIGTNVHDWKVDPIEEDDLPILLYRDISVATEIVNFNCFAHRMTVNISVAVTNSTPMTEIRKLIADLDKAIGVDETWGGLALFTIRIGDESSVEIGEKKFAGCQVNFEVTFRTLGWNDYTKL